MPQPFAPSDPETVNPETVQVAQIDSHIYVIRVIERGTFQNCGPLKEFVIRCMSENPDSEFIIDLGQSQMLDSTFIGVLAGIGLRQRKSGRGRMIIVNPNENITKVLTNLGLTRLLDVRPRAGALPDTAEVPGPRPGQFGPLGEDKPLSRLEQIRMMIEAHENLIQIGSNEAVKFRDVVECLKESLKRSGSPEAADINPSEDRPAPGLNSKDRA